MSDAKTKLGQAALAETSKASKAVAPLVERVAEELGQVTTRAKLTGAQLYERAAELVKSGVKPSYADDPAEIMAHYSKALTAPVKSSSSTAKTAASAAEPVVYQRAKAVTKPAAARPEPAPRAAALDDDTPDVPVNTRRPPESPEDYDLQQLRRDADAAQSAAAQRRGTPPADQPHTEADDLTVLSSVRDRLRTQSGREAPEDYDLRQLQLEADLAQTGANKRHGAELVDQAGAKPDELTVLADVRDRLRAQQGRSSPEDTAASFQDMTDRKLTDDLRRTNEARRASELPAKPAGPLSQAEDAGVAAEADFSRMMRNAEPKAGGMTKTKAVVGAAALASGGAAALTGGGSGTEPPPAGAPAAAESGSEPESAAAALGGTPDTRALATAAERLDLTTGRVNDLGALAALGDFRLPAGKPSPEQFGLDKQPVWSEEVEVRNPDGSTTRTTPADLMLTAVQSQRASIAEVAQQYREAKSDMSRREQWEKLIHGIGYLMAGLYGARSGVNMGGVKFDPTDWAARQRQLLAEQQLGTEQAGQEFKASQQNYEMYRQQLVDKNKSLADNWARNNDLYRSALQEYNHRVTAAYQTADLQLRKFDVARRVQDDYNDGLVKLKEIEARWSQTKDVKERAAVKDEMTRQARANDILRGVSKAAFIGSAKKASDDAKITAVGDMLTGIHEFKELTGKYPGNLTPDAFQVKGAEFLGWGGETRQAETPAEVYGRAAQLRAAPRAASPTAPAKPERKQIPDPDNPSQQIWVERRGNEWIEVQ